MQADAPCDCGSGLRRTLCCGLNLAAAPADAAASPLAERALQLRRQGADAAAERLCLEALELSPCRTDLLWLLSQLRAAQRNWMAVEALLGRIVALNPNAVAATQELGLCLLRRGALPLAELHARNAVRIAPDQAQSHHLLGMVLTESNQPAIGEFHYRRALELSVTRDPILLANLAWSLKLQSRLQEARALYQESAAAAPDVPQTLMGWARLEEADRAFAAAAALLDRIERIAPAMPAHTLLRAVIAGRTGNAGAALAILDRLAADRGDAGLAPEELLEKGRLLDRLGRHADAFATVVAAKRQSSTQAGHAYGEAHARSLAARLTHFLAAPRLAMLPRGSMRADSPQPLFILGFPRSGTTLVEQSLTAHPAIAAGDELPFIAEIVELMPRLLDSPHGYPEALSDLWIGDRREGLDSLRDYYLQRVRQRGILAEGQALFTDKMPLNEFHLGLIALIFPCAPMIHVLRHPLDVMLSVLSNTLTHGFYCGYTLETAARHYALTAELVAHYRGQMTLRYLPVRYEDILDDQEGQMRRMLDFLGLKFDVACLAPHENRRYARTASYAQVTEKLYDRSRGRWRRYREQLAPAIPILQPAMDRLGYSLD